jgi:hypothetical protein
VPRLAWWMARIFSVNQASVSAMLRLSPGTTLPLGRGLRPEFHAGATPQRQHERRSSKHRRTGVCLLVRAAPACPASARRRNRRVRFGRGALVRSSVRPHARLVAEAVADRKPAFRRKRSSALTTAGLAVRGHGGATPPWLVYGEEYRAADAQAVVDAVASGIEIPPTPSYG